MAGKYANKGNVTRSRNQSSDEEVRSRSRSGSPIKLSDSAYKHVIKSVAGTSFEGSRMSILKIRGSNDEGESSDWLEMPKGKACRRNKKIRSSTYEDDSNSEGSRKLDRSDEDRYLSATSRSSRTARKDKVRVVAPRSIRDTDKESDNNLGDSMSTSSSGVGIKARKDTRAVVIFDTEDEVGNSDSACTGSMNAETKRKVERIDNKLKTIKKSVGSSKNMKREYKDEIRDKVTLTRAYSGGHINRDKLILKNDGEIAYVT